MFCPLAPAGLPKAAHTTQINTILQNKEAENKQILKHIKYIKINLPRTAGPQHQIQLEQGPADKAPSLLVREKLAAAKNK